MKPITSYRYKYDSSLKSWTAKETIHLLLRIIPPVLSILVYLYGIAFLEFEIGVFVPFVVGNVFYQFLFFGKETRTIDFYPTFMSIGTQVIHFSDITEINTSDIDNGLVSIEYKSGRAIGNFTLDQSAFPTGARKDWKVEKNTREKLNKTIKRIVMHTNRLYQEYAQSGEAIENPLDSMPDKEKWL